MMNPCSECISAKPAAPLILACKVRDLLAAMQSDNPSRLEHTATAMTLPGQVGMNPKHQSRAALCWERSVSAAVIAQGKSPYRKNRIMGNVSLPAFKHQEKKYEPCLGKILRISLLALFIF